MTTIFGLLNSAGSNRFGKDIMELFLHLDSSLLLWIQEHLRFDALTPLMKFITSLGNAGIIWILLTLILLLIPKTRRIGILCVISLLLNVLFCNVLVKQLVARPRPYTRIQDLILLVKPARDYSFPSGHTSASFAVAWIVLKKLPKKAGVPLFVLAVLIAFSRLYVGIHYPSDVLGGFLLGTAVSLSVLKFAPVIEHHLCDKKTE